MKSTKMVVGLMACSLVLVLIAGCAEMTGSDLGSVLSALSTTGSGATGLDASTVAAGLKEALTVGSQRAVAETSKTNGFLDNSLIHIAMPEQLSTMATTLRSIGFGSQVDAMEVAMNRAAERASEEAKPVLIDAVSKMTLTDAMGILNGGNTAATDYFRSKTSDSLKAKFMPIIKDKMGQVGLYQEYNTLMSTYNALPLVKKPTFDLDQYVADKALAGLFTTLGQEEQKIRQDPAARTTELLKKVFTR